MRLALVADIHATLAGLEAVLEAMAKREAHGILLAGGLNDDPRTQYALLDWVGQERHASLEGAPFSYQAFKPALKLSGLLAAGGGFGGGVLWGAASGHNFTMDFLNHALRLAGQPGWQARPAAPRA